MVRFHSAGSTNVRWQISSIFLDRSAKSLDRYFRADSSRRHWNTTYLLIEETVFVHDFQPFHPRFTRVVLKIWIIHGEHQCVHYSVIKMDSTSFFFGMFIATRQIHRIKIDFEDTNKGTTTINKEINDWQRDWRENAFVLINRGSLLACFFLSCNAICGLILGFLAFTSFKLYRQS